MDITEDRVNEHNLGTIQKCMDILEYFSDRVKSIAYYIDEPAEWCQKTVVCIHGVENNPDSGRHKFVVIDLLSPKHSGELSILIDLIGLDLQGLYKGAFTSRSLCSLRSTPPVLLEGKYISEVYIVFTLEYINDSFPLHEGAIRELKRQLRAYTERIGFSVPDNLK